MPRTKTCKKGQVYWWTKEINEAKKNVFNIDENIRVPI